MGGGADPRRHTAPSYRPAHRRIEAGRPIQGLPAAVTIAADAEGVGIVLRPPWEGEAVDVLKMLHDPEVVQWNPAADVRDRVTAAAWCRRGGDWSTGDHATFSIIDRRDSRYLGNVSLFAIDDDNASCEIGYRVAPWARRRGVGAAAVDAATGWAFSALGLHRVQLLHAVPNVASCRLAQRCRFVLEGLARSAVAGGDGVRYDAHLHGRLVTD